MFLSSIETSETIKEIASQTIEKAAKYVDLEVIEVAWTTMITAVEMAEI